MTEYQDSQTMSQDVKHVDSFLDITVKKCVQAHEMTNPFCLNIITFARITIHSPFHPFFFLWYKHSHARTHTLPCPGCYCGEREMPTTELFKQFFFFLISYSIIGSTIFAGIGESWILP